MKNILRTFATTLLAGLAIIAGCPSQPISSRQPTTAPAFRSQLHVTEQVLCQLPEEIITSVVSPRQLHFAYVCPKGDKKVAVLDGVAGPEFDDIPAPGEPLPGKSDRDTLHFSEDEKHLAYPARHGDKWLVVKDGVAGDKYDYVLAESLHFDDKGRLIYAASSIGSQFRVVDGQATLISTQAGDSPFVESNGHIAYIKKENGNEMVMLDGKGGPRFDEIDASSLAFKSGGEPMYIARRDKQWFVVQGDKPGESSDEIKDLQIAPGGNQWVYASRHGDKWFAIVNDHPQGPYHDEFFCTCFSDDGNRLAYLVCDENAGWYLVVDGKMSERYVSVCCPEFSPDGKRIIYDVIRPDGSCEILIDSKSRRRVDCDLFDLGFNTDGRHFLGWAIATGQRGMVFADDRREGPFDVVFFRHRFGQPPSEGPHLTYVAAHNTRLPKRAITVCDEGFAGLIKGSKKIHEDGGQWFVVVDGWAGPTYDRVLSTAAIGDEGKARYLAVRGNMVLRVTMDLPPAGVPPTAWAIPSAKDLEPLNPLTRNPKDTVVAPNLQQPVIEGKNALWCASFQIAWNELIDFSGGPIVLKDPPPMVDALNQRIVNRADMDPASVVAVAGTIESGVIEKARADLTKKFPNASAGMLPSTEGLQPKYVVAYAYFKKQLPFEFAFDRDSGMPFGPPPAEGEKDMRSQVDWFGLAEYMPGNGNQDRLASQIRIIWHKFGEKDPGTEVQDQEFIVELLTKAKNDRLILARIEPGKDLLETTRRVMEHLAKPNSAGIKDVEAAKEAYQKAGNANPFGRNETSEDLQKQNKLLQIYQDKLSQCSCLLDLEGLQIPVIDLDLAKDFTDLCGRVIVSKNPKLNGLPIIRASQNIRFKLDETGADLESSAQINAGGLPTRSFVFDRPFLVLLMQKGAKQPYFALWVGNAELLVRSGR